MSKKEFMSLMQEIQLYYSNFQLNKEIVQAWYEILQRYEYEAIRFYLHEYVKTNVFDPKISNLTSPYLDQYQRIKTAKEESEATIYDWTDDSTEDIRQALKEWLKKIPFLRREKAVRNMANKFRDYADEEKISFLEWLNEYK